MTLTTSARPPIQAEEHLRSPTGAEPPNPASKAAPIQAEGHLRGASARTGPTHGPHADCHQSPETSTVTHVLIQNCHQSPETSHATVERGTASLGSAPGAQDGEGREGVIVRELDLPGFVG